MPGFIVKPHPIVKLINEVSFMALIYWLECGVSLHSVLGLKFLVRLCTDMNLADAQDYANKLKKAEKMQKMREEVGLIIFITVII